jgi:hypothetical protein
MAICQRERWYPVRSEVAKPRSQTYSPVILAKKGGISRTNCN